MLVLALLFILSGAAGLIYESVWARYISLLVGHSAYAQVIVLVIFLGGMAIGSLVVARWSERIRSPLLWYAVVEAIIALIALAFHPVFVATTGFAYEQILPKLSAGAPATAITWTLAALLILPQSILLGATFPLMTAGALRRNAASTGSSIGLLYFANSFGAAIGALVGGFALVAAFGLPGTLRAAAALNVFVALGVFMMTGLTGRRVDGLTGDNPATRQPADPPTRQPVNPVLLGVSFATAFSSFIYEIAWTRMLSLVNGSATHSFELMLSAFILGLAFGSLFISSIADTTADRMRLLARMQWAMGLAAIATLPLYLWSFDWTASLLGALRDTESAYHLYSVARYAIALAIMLPATFCAGTTLPLITRILLASGSGERVIGGVYGVNTIGSIAGASIAALVLMPLLGLKWLLIGGGLIDIAVGVGLLVRMKREPQHGWTTAIGMTLAAITGLAIMTPFAPTRLGSGVFRYKFVPKETDLRYLFYKDGRTASVGVRQDASDTTSLLVIATNGKPDASMPPAWMRPADSTQRLPLDQDMSTQILLPLLVLAHAPDAKHGAVIGQGSGITSHILLTSPTIERLHTIEIEPEMIRGSHLFYPGNKRVFDDPRSSFEIDDARAFLSASGPAFDFVVSEPSNPWVSGVSGLFTEEFYGRVKSRLRQGGIFTQWFHMYEMDDASVAAVLAGIDHVFTDYRMYVSSNSDIIIVASAGAPLPAADWSVTEFPSFASDLEHFAPLGAETLDATVVAGRKTLTAFLATAVVNSDYHPVLDLNGERLRFRNMFADGFRELAESQFDIAAALEGRRRPLGTVIDNPAPEIVRAEALSLGARLRVANGFESVEATGDSTVRVAEARSLDFQAGLGAALAARNWSEWLTDFDRVEADLHGGSAGFADEAFYKRVRAYLDRVKAPDAVRAVVDFRHGLAAWDFPEAARAGDFLIGRLQEGESWIAIELLRRGTAVARIRTGDMNGAGRLFASALTMGGDWSLVDRVLQAYIISGLTGRQVGGSTGSTRQPGNPPAREPVNHADASVAPGRLRH